MKRMSKIPLFGTCARCLIVSICVYVWVRDHLLREHHLLHLIYSIAQTLFSILVLSSGVMNYSFEITGEKLETDQLY